MSTRHSPRPDARQSVFPHWVLIVDDDADVGRMLVRALEEEQVEVLVAKSGADALKLLAARKAEPLLVLSDVLMPGVDGLTLVRQIRQTLNRGKLALMSGHLSDNSWWPDDLRDVPFLAKPFPLARLAELIREARLGYER